MAIKFPLQNIRQTVSGQWDTIHLTETATVSVSGIVALDEVPDNGIQTGNTRVTISGLTETITYPPSAGYFWVNYYTGKIAFHNDQIGNTYDIDYWAKGSLIEAEDINYLYDTLDGVIADTVFLSGAIDNLESSNLSSDILFLSGAIDNVVSDTVFLSGAIDNVVSDTVFLSGAIDNVISDTVFLSGAIDNVISDTVFLSGAIDNVISDTVFLSGAIDNNSTDIIFLSGAIPDMNRILIPEVNGSPEDVTNLEDAFYRFWSAGVVSGFDWVDNGNGTINLSAGEVILRTSNSQTAPLVSVAIDAVIDITIIENAENYICADWNNGTPFITVKNSIDDTNARTPIGIWWFSREGNQLYAIDRRYQNIDSNAKHRRVLLKCDKFRHATDGSVIQSYPNRYIGASEGSFFFGLNGISHSSFNTSIAGTDPSHVFNYYHTNVGGGWTKIINQKSIDFVNYDNAGVLTPLQNNNKFKCDYVYLLLDQTQSHLMVIYGNTQFGSYADADNSQIPSSIPTILKQNGVLIGRLIIQKNAVTFSAVQSAFTETLSYVGVSSHNDLSNIQGGFAGDDTNPAEYYHLTAQERDYVADFVSLSGNYESLSATYFPLSTPLDNHVPAGYLEHDSTTLLLTENVGGTNDTFTVTVSATDGNSFPVYIDSKKMYLTTQTITISGATSKRYYIFFDNTGILQYSINPWPLSPEEGFAGEAPTCTVLWDAVNHQGILEEERHHSWRDIHWHHWAHHSIGPRYSFGHTANGLNLSNPSSDNYTTFQILEGEIYDEDIRDDTPTSTSGIILYNHTDSTMKWVATTKPYITINNVPQYDNGTGLVSKTASNTLGYFVSWVYITNAMDSDHKVAFVVGQDTDGNMTLLEAQSAPLPTLPTDFVVEWKLCWKIIYRYAQNGIITWISNTDYRTAGSLPAGQVQSSNIAAVSVSFTPTSTITATNVQAAIEELIADIDDIPVDGETSAPISSNWAYDHENNTTTKHLPSQTDNAGKLLSTDGVAASWQMILDGGYAAG